MSSADIVQTSRSSGERLGEIRLLFSNGEFFRAYDLAIGALQDFPGDIRFAHRAVLSLANAGATKLALQKFEELGLNRSQALEVRTLLGRLKKDLAFNESGEERQQHLKEAQFIYQDAYDTAVTLQDVEAYYPGINAAALALFSGEFDTAVALAAEVRDLVKARLGTSSIAQVSDRYWLLATAIEANFIADNFDTAKALISPAIEAGALNYAELATTGRQLERILVAKGLDRNILGGFVPPAIVHYAGHIIAAPGRPGRFLAEEETEIRSRIGAMIDRMRISAAYGSLAAGADLLFAEMFLRRGIAVNIVLPFRVEDMLEQSVRCAGESWIPRFEECLQRAHTVRYATEDAYLGDDQLFNYSSSLAMGLAVLSARHMRAPVSQLVVWDGEAKSGAAGTVADMTAWLRAGLQQTVIRCGTQHPSDDLETYRRPKVPRGRRDTRAMLFGDISGFSKLTDEQLPIFTREILGTIGRVLNRYKEDISVMNTWGDGIFAVFSDAGQAADCALAIQDAMESIDLKTLNLPHDLKLRLGGHLGPVYELDDPILGRPNCYGAHVGRAARIEPVTPEGCIYITETFAAVLALYNAKEFACDYVGYTEAAKHYGRLRMFLLRRSEHGDGPVVLADLER
jgi:class 3 adenylate cyclase